LELRTLVREIAEFKEWNHAEKITFFAWFLHSQRQIERLNSSDIKSCYDALHLERPSKIYPFLASMTMRKPKKALKDSQGYYLVAHVRDEYETKFADNACNPTPKTELVLPHSVVEGTRGYLQTVIQQANGCYEHQWFDACAVMIRKFAEILIIEIYEAHGRAGEIKDRQGDFLMLRDLVSMIIADTAWSLSRETKKVLPVIKSLGDRSAHNRRYLAKQDDVDKVIPGLRVLTDDLLHLTNLK